jgi:Mn-dependent DtxR family transcriptional regulator
VTELQRNIVSYLRRVVSSRSSRMATRLGVPRDDVDAACRKLAAQHVVEHSPDWSWNLRVDYVPVGGWRSLR